MKRTTSPFYARRTFILSLLSFIAVAAVVSFSVSARKASREAVLRAISNKAIAAKPDAGVQVQDKNPNVPDVASMTATLNDNVTAGSKVPPGGTINYEAKLNNIAGAAALGANDAGAVVYDATLDANTTLTGVVQVSPVTRNDNYPNTVIGNVAINSDNTPFNVLTNDYMGQNPAGTVTAGNFTSAQGGNVVMDADGTFTYNPPAGYEGADSFTYTLSNAAGSSIGTVNFTVAGMVWFINNNTGGPACITIAAGCGRITNPFTDLGSFNGVNNGGVGSTNPAINDNIFIYESPSAYNNSVTLLNGQRLIGQDSTSTLATLTGISVPAGSTPFPTMNSGNATITKITSGTGNGITLNILAGTNVVNGLTVGNTTGSGIFGNGFGTVTIADVSIDEPAATRTGQALSLTTGAVTATFGTVESSSGTNNVSLVSVTGNINLGTGALSLASDNALTISGGGNTATISYAGTISNTTDSAVSIANKTGGTVTLSGLITGGGSDVDGGISLITNTGTTMNFTGGINLSMTGAAPGFTATGGGTVSVTDPNALGTVPDNTISTATGTALNVANTTIGGSGLNFRSISSSGAANGIILNTTGAGGLTVTGNSAGICGGSVTNTTTPGTIATVTAANTGDCTGGTIQNSTGTGVSLVSTSNVSLTRMNITGGGNDGMAGSNVTNLTLSAVNIANNGNAVGESGMDFGLSGSNLLGTVSITNSSVTGNFSDNFKIINTSGTLSSLTIDNCQFSQTSIPVSPAGGNGFVMNTQGTSVVTTASITDSIFRNNFSNGVLINSENTSNIATFTVQNSSFDDNNISLQCGQFFSSNFTCRFITNTVFNNGRVATSGANSTSTAIIAATSSTATGGTLNSRIDGNFVGSNTVGGSGSSTGNGIRSIIQGLTDATVTIVNNTVRECPIGFGLDIESLGSTSGTPPVSDMTIKNNNVNHINLGFNPGTSNFPLPAIYVSGDNQGTAGQFRTDVTGNTVPASCTGQFLGKCLELFEYTGPNGDLRLVDTTAPISGTCDSEIQATNTGSSGASAGCVLIAGPINTQAWYRPEPNSSSDFFARANQPSQNSSYGSLASFLGANNHTKEIYMAFFKSVNESNGSLHDSSAFNAQQTFTAQAAVVGESKGSFANSLSRRLAGVTNSIAEFVNNVDSLIVPTAEAASATSSSKAVRSHHAQFNRTGLTKASMADKNPLAPEADVIGPIAIGTLEPGKSVTIKYSATVNLAPTARQANHQGSFSFTNGGTSPLLTDDTDQLGGAANPTVTLFDILMTWNGNTSTDWNTATNWTPPAGGTAYVPGVTNPAVNDVVIPIAGVTNQPTIGPAMPDVTIFSLNFAAGTLTIDPARKLTIGAPAPGVGGDLTLNGVITGGELRFGTGSHNFNVSGGSLSSTNLMTVLSGSNVTLNQNLQAGMVGVDSGGTFNITNRTLSLNGSTGLALNVPLGATFTTAGSTVVMNANLAQTIANATYNNLSIENTVGLHGAGVFLQGDATVNGVLALTSCDLVTGASTLIQPNTTLSTGVNDVVGTVRRSGGPFAANTPLTFGNPDNRITFTVAGTRPTQIDVTMAKSAPAGYAGAVLRNYIITPTGGSGYSATLRLHYLQGELNGHNEATLNLRRYDTTTTTWRAVTPSTRDAVNDWVEAPTSIFSQWTFSSLTPTASDGVVTGRIVDDNGAPVEGAVVRMSGSQNRKFITNANGVYRFENVEANGFYNVTPTRVNYNFSPAVISFSQLGETTEAGFGATATGGDINPLDTPEYFVRQNYLDFLGREPDEAGFNFWSDQILSCGGDTDCVDRKRTHVSAAYFLSIEFQETGGLVDGVYRASFGRRPSYGEFQPDAAAVAPGLVVGRDGWRQSLDSGKAAFVEAFVQRAAFQNAYAGLSNEAYVDALIANTGVSFTSAARSALVSDLGNGMTRAGALRAIAENPNVVAAKRNEAFVMMEYFGYLRREPDAGGYLFWLTKLNQFNGNFEQAEMVRSFIVSGEYRDRFPR